MIYVRDYGALGRCAQPEPPDSLEARLRRLTGRAVTVYVTGGGESGRGFSGILIEVTGACIRLVAGLPSPGGRCPGGMQRGPGLPGTSVVIPLRQIAALVYVDAGAGPETRGKTVRRR